MRFWYIGAFALAGWLLGFALIEPSAARFGMIIGAALGYLAAQLRAYERRIATLEAQLAGAGPSAEAAPAPIETDAGARWAAMPAHGAIQADARGEEPAEARLVAPPQANGAAGGPLPTTAMPPATAMAAEALPAPITRLFDGIRGWFAEGNVPVKVGMLVLFAGVAALLQYATNAGWIRIELRLALIALAAIAGLGFGFRQRIERRTFGLSLQGGAIGVLTLVVFAAFRLYELLPASAAFALLAALVAGAGLLALLQNSLALAVLGSLAGFLAPILVSTGSNDHMALFAWYAILDASIFALAWRKAWRLLNLLGFVCTFAVATAWGALRYDPGQFSTTEPFVLLFFAFYLAIPVLYARRTRAAPAPHGGRLANQGIVDGTLVFGTPLVTFGLQAILLEGEPMPLALSALGLAAIHVGLAAALIRSAAMRVLAESHAILAIAFATLTIPLALSGEATAGIFALEGAALIWLGLRQDRLLARLTGLALQPLAGIAWCLGNQSAAMPLANGPFVGLLLLALGGWFGAWLWWRSGRDWAVALLLHLLASGWWIFGGLREIDRFAPYDTSPYFWLAFAASSAWLAAELRRRIPARALAWNAALPLALAVPILLAQLALDEQPFAGLGLPAWICFVILGARTLFLLRDASRGAVRLGHLGWLWGLPAALGFALGAWADDLQLGAGGSWSLGRSWVQTLVIAPILATAVATLLSGRRRGAAGGGTADGGARAAAVGVRAPWIAWPLASRFDETRPLLLPGQALLLSLCFTVALFLPGDAAPLPWLPLLNPLELALLASLAFSAAWMASDDAPAVLRRRWKPLLCLGSFALLTAAVLRGVHHLADLPWNLNLLDSAAAQASLSVAWSIAGVIAWVVGSRRQNRSIWLAGALLMGVVLAKLALIDRQHLGNLAGIGSFLAYGLLCTVVGYLAPAPATAPPPNPEPMIGNAP